MKKIVNLFIWILLAGLLVLGSLGLYLEEVRVFGAVFLAALLLFIFISKRKILIPRGFNLFLLFLIFLGVNVIWSQDRLKTLEYLVLFAGGGAFWLVMYNLQEQIQDRFEWIIVGLGILLGASYLADLFMFSKMPIRPWSLYLPSTIYRNHNHLGDLWAIVLVVVANKLLSRSRRVLYWMIVIMGIFFLMVSLSRSAYLALIVGVVYLFNKIHFAKKYKKFQIFFLVLAAGFFLYAGAFKSTLFARPYFEQVIYGLKNWPFGVGVGNFGIISSSPNSPWWNGAQVGIISSSAHNVILEMIAGMGFLGLIFATWFIYILKDVVKYSKNILYSSIFLAIAANFMFDTTYYIPAMLWLWFACLGLSQVTRGGVRQ